MVWNGSEKPSSQLEKSIHQSIYIVMFRNPHTRNEMRQNADPSVMKFVRAKRRRTYLPDNRDDILECLSGSWKDNSKSRHQWARHPKRLHRMHADDIAA